MLSINAIFVVFERNEVYNSVNSSPNVMYFYTAPWWYVSINFPKFGDERSKIKVKVKHKSNITIIAITSERKVIEISSWHQNMGKSIGYNFLI